MIWRVDSAAAQRAGIPSVIISNFTFDSCYSYLSVSTEADHAALRLSDVAESLTISEGSSPSSSSSKVPFPAIEEESEPPIPAEYLAPLVKRAIQDYANASLLLRLPGAIPIPAFDQDVHLPAPLWTDLKSHSFNGRIMDLLARDPSLIPCNGETSHTNGTSNGAKGKRRVVDTPLITRPVSKDVYSQEARHKLLNSLDIPEEKHDAKILVVSFGGQSIPHPASRPPSPLAERDIAHHPTASNKVHQLNGALSPPPSAASNGTQAASMQRVITQNHMYLPGAPPALHQIDPSTSKRQSALSPRSVDPASSRKNHRRRISIELQPTFSTETSPVLDTEFDMDESNLLPPGWIAVVCGLSSKNPQEELPPDFYAAPRDIYVPDLTAICDVLLGKLVSTMYVSLSKSVLMVSSQGYGTCSETVATQTPFLYVPRPLFVEEFGLKRLMDQRGTALPMTRADFEAGRWSKLVLQAYEMGKKKKEQHREDHLARLASGEQEESAGTIISLELEKFMRESIR